MQIPHERSFAQEVTSSNKETCSSTSRQSQQEPGLGGRHRIEPLLEDYIESYPAFLATFALLVQAVWEMSKKTSPCKKPISNMS